MPQDDYNPARGVFYGLVLSIPVWGIIWLIVFVARAIITGS